MSTATRLVEEPTGSTCVAPCNSLNGESLANMPKSSSFAGKMLGSLEGTIMDVLWTHGECSVRSVADRLTKKGQPAYTTVMTVMSRLAEKGLLARRLESRAYLYRPTLTKEEFQARAARAGARALVKDFGDLALAHFVEEIERVDPSRLARLSKFLKDRKGR